MICKNGPLDGCHIGNRPEQFVMIAFYNDGDKTVRTTVYENQGNHWQFDYEATMASNGENEPTPDKPRERD